MRKLFATQSALKHQALLCEPSQWENIREFINRKPMPDADSVPEFKFKEFKEKSADFPRICTVYFPGVLAFRRELKNKIFPIYSGNLEFFPITVLNEPWLLLSCLQAAEIDVNSSSVMRGINGEIWHIMNIFVTDPKAKSWEIFTLKDSNRTQIFVTNTFRERIQKLGLNEIGFKEAGELI